MNRRNKVIRMMMFLCLLLIIFYQYKQKNILEEYTYEVSMLMNKLEFIIQNVSSPVLFKSVYEKYKKEIYHHLNILYYLSLAYNNNYCSDYTYDENIMNNIQKLLILQNRDSNDTIYNIFLMLKSIQNNLQDTKDAVGAIDNITFDLHKYMVFKVFDKPISEVEQSLIDKVSTLMKRDDIKILPINEQAEIIKTFLKK